MLCQRERFVVLNWFDLTTNKLNRAVMSTVVVVLLIVSLFRIELSILVHTHKHTQTHTYATTNTHTQISTRFQWAFPVEDVR